MKAKNNPQRKFDLPETGQYLTTIKPIPETKNDQSERKFRQILDSLPEGIQIIDFEWRYIYINHSLAESENTTKESLIGHTMMEKYPGIEQTELFQKLKECMIDRKSHCFKNEFVYVDKPTRMFELRIEPVDEGIFVISIDITESCEAEEKINTATKLYNDEKENRAAELIITNSELLFQNQEKEKRAAELIIANKELLYQNNEKEKRAIELIIANKELLFQNREKEKRAEELIVANDELAFQNKEKERKAEELIVANKELAFQNQEKEKRAEELIIANKELAFQNQEKEKRAQELIVANKELAFQNEEKEKRAEELIIANTELAFQNKEKSRKKAELVIANNELAFQNGEKEKRAAELIIANQELLFQNKEKEKREEQLSLAYVDLKNSEEYLKHYVEGLEAMMFMTSHRVRQPVAHILGISDLLVKAINSPGELMVLMGFVKASAIAIDDYTKELTLLMTDLGQKVKR